MSSGITSALLESVVRFVSNFTAVHQTIDIEDRSHFIGFKN